VPGHEAEQLVSHVEVQTSRSAQRAKQLVHPGDGLAGRRDEDAVRGGLFAHEQAARADGGDHLPERRIDVGHVHEHEPAVDDVVAGVRQGIDAESSLGELDVRETHLDRVLSRDVELCGVSVRSGDVASFSHGPSDPRGQRPGAASHVQDSKPFTEPDIHQEGPACGAEHPFDRIEAICAVLPCLQDVLGHDDLRRQSYAERGRRGSC